jgi:hypothetical protein
MINWAYANAEAKRIVPTISMAAPMTTVFLRPSLLPTNMHERQPMTAPRFRQALTVPWMSELCALRLPVVVVVLTCSNKVYTDL